MADEDEWSYDVGEFGDEDTEQADEESVRSPDREAGADDADDEGGWRFSLADLEEDDEEDDTGWLDLSAEVEAGSPNLENVLFVLLGVALGVVVAFQLFL